MRLYDEKKITKYVEEGREQRKYLVEKIDYALTDICPEGKVTHQNHDSVIALVHTVMFLDIVMHPGLETPDGEKVGIPNVGDNIADWVERRKAVIKDGTEAFLLSGSDIYGYLNLFHGILNKKTIRSLSMINTEIYDKKNISKRIEEGREHRKHLVEKIDYALTDICPEGKVTEQNYASTYTLATVAIILDGAISHTDIPILETPDGEKVGIPNVGDNIADWIERRKAVIKDGTEAFILKGSSIDGYLSFFHGILKKETRRQLSMMLYY